MASSPLPGVAPSSAPAIRKFSLRLFLATAAALVVLFSLSFLNENTHVQSRGMLSNSRTLNYPGGRTPSEYGQVLMGNSPAADEELGDSVQMAMPMSPRHHRRGMSKMMAAEAAAPPQAMADSAGELSSINRMRKEEKDEAINIYRMNAAQQAAANMQNVDVPDDPSVVKGKLVIKRADLTSEAPNVGATGTAIEAAVVAAGGYVEESNAVRDVGLVARVLEFKKVAVEGPTRVAIKLRVPVAAFDSTMRRIRELISAEETKEGVGGGRIVAENIAVDDVTSHYRDIVTRVHIDEVALKRTEILMTAAVTIDEILRIKHELDVISARIETAKGARKDLEEQAVYSTIRCTLSVPEPPPPQWEPPAPHSWSPLRAAAAAIAIVLNTAKATIDVIVFLSILALPIGVILLGGAWLCYHPARRAAVSAAQMGAEGVRRWNEIVTQLQRQGGSQSPFADRAGSSGSGGSATAPLMERGDGSARHTHDM